MKPWCKAGMVCQELEWSPSACVDSSRSRWLIKNAVVNVCLSFCPQHGPQGLHGWCYPTLSSSHTRSSLFSLRARHLPSSPLSSQNDPPPLLPCSSPAPLSAFLFFSFMIDSCWFCGHLSPHFSLPVDVGVFTALAVSAAWWTA